jgi:protein gp37
MSKTKISWTDQTWNVITGCSKRSIGCANCYAESFTQRISVTVPKYKMGFENIVSHLGALEEIKKIKHPQRIFVNSMSDTFHEKVSYAFLIKLFETIKQYPQHRFVILTKRPTNLLKFQQHVNLYYKDLNPIFGDNVWIGISAETNDIAIARLCTLQRVQCVHKFINFEPLLENIPFKHVYSIYRDKLDWVIIGAESGPTRRKCKIEWIENIMDEARQENIPVFIKQIDLKGKCVTESYKFPDHLRCRMFPEGY